MTSCGKDCDICPEARKNGNRTICLFYGMPIWGRKKDNEKTTTRNDKNLRGLREGNHPETRMDI